MTERRDPARGIRIPEEVAEAAALPEDLDADLLSPYAIPSPVRRRRTAMIYLAGAAVTALGIVAGLPSGMWLTVGLLVAIAAHHLLTAWDLGIREGQALEVANRTIGFPVGHASANLGFRGWRSRPVWNVLVFSADDPPSRRGLVRVDGVDASVVELYEEAIPEEDQ